MFSETSSLISPQTLDSMSIGSYLNGVFGNSKVDNSYQQHGPTEPTLWDKIMNHPNYQRQKYEEAGFNPNLAGVTAGSDVGSPANLAGAAAGAAQGAAGAAQTAIGAYQAVRTQNATIEQAHADARKANADAEGSEIGNSILKQTQQINVQDIAKGEEEVEQAKIKTRLDNTNAELRAIELDIAKETKGAQTQVLQQQLKNLQKQASVITAQAAAIVTETNLNKKREKTQELINNYKRLENSQKAWENKYRKESAVNPTFLKYKNQFGETITNLGKLLLGGASVAGRAGIFGK